MMYHVTCEVYNLPSTHQRLQAARREIGDRKWLQHIRESSGYDILTLNHKYCFYLAMKYHPFRQDPPTYNEQNVKTFIQGSWKFQ